SCSSWTTDPPPGLVATAMDILLVCSRPSGLGAGRLGHAGHDRRLIVDVLLRLHALGLRVLAGDPFDHGRPAHLKRTLRELLLVLAAVAEPVRADRGDLVLDLLGRPDAVRVLVLAPHLPLALVVVEGGLVDHGDAVLHGADRLADSAATARLH